MAPRRGGGGSSSSSSNGGGSDPVCLGFLAANKVSAVSTPIVRYVSYCLFFTLTVAVFIAACCTRKRAARLKHLLLTTLSFMALAWALVVIGTTIRECSVGNPWNYFNFVIAFDIFFDIGQYILLVIQVWGVNNLLSKRLASGETAVRIITLAIVGVMGALTAGFLGLQSYNAWQFTPSGKGITKYDEENKLAVAYWALYLVSVLTGGALSVALLLQLRSRNVAISDILKRTIALTLCMLLWVIFNLVPYADTLEEKFASTDTYTALYYLTGFFQIFSYIAIISLAKSESWKEGIASQTAYSTTGYGQPAYVQPPMQQFAYNGQSGQRYYYQHEPVHNGVPAPVSSNGHMVQVK